MVVVVSWREFRNGERGPYTQIVNTLESEAKSWESEKWGRDE